MLNSSLNMTYAYMSGWFILETNNSYINNSSYLIQSTFISIQIYSLSFQIAFTNCLSILMLYITLYEFFQHSLLFSVTSFGIQPPLFFSSNKYFITYAFIKQGSQIFSLFLFISVDTIASTKPLQLDFT